MYLGNYGLSTYDDVSEEYINDMPFLIEYGPQDTGTGLEWYHEMSIAYPDENEHTIKVEKIIGTIEPIAVKNFATEIKNMPGGGLSILDDWNKVHVIINYDLEPCGNGNNENWHYFSVGGFEVKNNKIEHYSFHVDVDNSGTSGTIEFDSYTNTGIEIICWGSSPLDSFWCTIDRIEVKLNETDEWYEGDLSVTNPNPEEKLVYLSYGLNGNGAPYKFVRLTVSGTPPFNLWG